jgi:hypothetical protein
MRGTTVALLGISIAALSAAAGAQERRAFSGDTFTWSERIAPGAWLRIYDPNGRIEVTAAPGDVAEVRAERSGENRAEIDVEIHRDGGNVTLCARIDESECDEDGIRSRRSRRGRDRESRGRVHFVVRVPRGVRRQGGTGNGEVSVAGASAEVSAASGNGRVRVTTSSGGVRASSGNGDVTVEGATDEVTASTGNGRVLVATSRGPVSASSGNGDIDVRMDALGDSGDMTFSTGNGRITVAVPRNFAGEIEGTMGHGELRSDFPMTITGRLSRSHVRATIGSGGPRVRMSSGNGDLELVKRGGS